ncbi:hypothetical protein SBADM41S_06748 [Streptomyces badius]
MTGRKPAAAKLSASRQALRARRKICRSASSSPSGDGHRPPETMSSWRASTSMWAEAANRAASAAATVLLPLPGMPVSRTVPAAGGSTSTGTSVQAIPVLPRSVRQYTSRTYLRSEASCLTWAAAASGSSPPWATAMSRSARSTSLAIREASPQT